MPTPQPDDPRVDPILRDVPEEAGAKLLDRRYEIEISLGRGGMGAVYRARHRTLGRTVAIKVLDPGLVRASDEAVKRFHREANAAERVRAENVVEVQDVSEAHGLHYIVMEFVEGENARQRVARKGTLAIDEAVTIALGAARGLSAAHRAGLVHRDVKPGNVLIAKDGRVKLADLGLAKDHDLDMTLSLSGRAMGTPRYMPPEQFQNAKGVRATADVYSLGATLYFLLTGRDGFQSKDPFEAHDDARLTAFPDPRELRPDVPAPLAGLIEHCTRKDPAERPTSALEVVLLLQDALGPVPTSLADDEAGSQYSDELVSPPPPAHAVSVELTLEPTVSDTAEAHRRLSKRAGWAVAGVLAALAGLGVWHLLDENPDGPPAGVAYVPEYDVVEPFAAAVVAADSVQVVLRVRRLGRGSVAIDGSPATLDGDLWRGSARLPAEGRNDVEIVLEPEVGEQRSSIVTLLRDLTAPALPTASPVGRETFRGGGPEPVELICPGETSAVRVETEDGTLLGTLTAGRGQLNLNIPLHDDPKEAEVDLPLVMRDAAGNVANHTLRLLVEPRPWFSMGVPAPWEDPVWLRAPRLRLTGSVPAARSSSFDVLFDGALVGEPVTFGVRGQFDLELELPGLTAGTVSLRTEGAHDYTFKVRPDTSSPKLEILAPEDGWITNGTQVDVSLLASDAALERIEVQGEPIELELGTSRLQTTVPAVPLRDEGPNTIRVRAFDTAVNLPTTVEITVVRDLAAPSLLSSVPIDGAKIDKDTLKITLRFNEVLSSLTLGGEPYLFVPLLTEFKPVVTLAPRLGDPNTRVLIWEATDRAGNRSSGTLSFTLE